MRRDLFICLLLAGITLAIYWPARNFDLYRVDDQLFLTENPEIQSGLNGHSVIWAMTGVVAVNWHPVTNLSFVLGHQFWGTNPGAEHLVNVAIHALNAALLFLVLQQMTRSPWRSAMVAALFAWHPLRVESVAWIAERKDVLSVFFFFLTLLAWVRYVENSKVQSPKSKVWHGLALFFFALGLMSKAMLVTVPIVLLLLDVWPLRRVAIDTRKATRNNNSRPRPGKRSWLPQGFPTAIGKRLLLEKWPFFALAAAVSVITFLVQHSGAATTSLKMLGPEIRLENIIVSYLRYLAWTVWPTNLAAYYMFPFDSHFHLALWPDWEIGAAALLLACVSALCLVQIVRRPYLAVGWFWYLVTMAPVIGLVQVGRQGMADRYTYIPLLGPVISLVWLISEKWASGIFSRTLLAIVTTAVLAASILQTRHQLQFWKNTETLSQHTMEATGESAQAEYKMGLALEQKGDIRQAIVHYNNAMTMQPTVDEAYWAMGRLFSQQGNWTVTEKIYSLMLRIERDDFTSHLGLAAALPHLGRTDEAVTQLKAALRTCPDTPGAKNNLAWTLATSGEAVLRDGAQAVQYAERACDLTHYQETVPIGTLAAAYAEAGRFDEAMATAQRACALAEKSGEPELLKRNQELLELYRARQPYHEAP
jgi:Flp pilus assembly protein TadD